MLVEAFYQTFQVIGAWHRVLYEVVDLSDL